MLYFHDTKIFQSVEQVHNCTRVIDYIITQSNGDKKYLTALIYKDVASWDYVAPKTEESINKAAEAPTEASIGAKPKKQPRK